MSLFVAGLAFGDGNLLSVAKVGVLAASSVAGVVGFIMLRTAARGVQAGMDQEI